VRHVGAMLGLIIALLLACNNARAETPVSPLEPWLLGNWGGLRTRLFEKGIDFQIVYASEVAYNAAGGAKSLVDYADQVAVGSTLDLERLIGLPGTILQVTFTERAGRNLVDDAQLNTLQLVQEVYGRGQTTRLTQLWLEHTLLNGLVSLKWGRVAMGGDFAVFPCDFQNLTFCGSNPGNLVGSYIYNWPISQWGGRARVTLEGFGYVQAGVYDQNDQYLGYTDKLLPVWYPGSTGVLVPAEIAWLPTFGGGSLPGSYKIGGWYSSSKANDAALDVNGNLAAVTGLPSLQHRGLYGGFFTFQQQVMRNASEDPNGGLRVFLNGVVADSATSVTDYQIAAGFTYTGPFSWRPHDVIGFAAGATHVNSRVTDAQNLQNAIGLGPVAVKNSEYVLELYYTIAPLPGLLIRPNLQYINTPGGTYLNKDVLVLGLKTVISF
jgi:porin